MKRDTPEPLFRVRPYGPVVPILTKGNNEFIGIKRKSSVDK